MSGKTKRIILICIAVIALIAAVLFIARAVYLRNTSEGPPPASGNSSSVVPGSSPGSSGTVTEPESDPDPGKSGSGVSATIDENGSYTTKEDVALYIHIYGKLPPNFITKAQAKKLGWSSGSLEKYASGCCIGGDRFGNREGLLPEAPGRVYYECDINTVGQKNRGAERIVFSNDGLIYYTGDHYETFELLYGEE